MGPDNSAGRDFLDGIIEEFYLKIDSFAKQFPSSNILSKAGEAGKRIARKHPAKVTDDVSFIVVLGRLDENDSNLSAFACSFLYHGFTGLPIASSSTRMLRFEETTCNTPRRAFT